MPTTPTHLSSPVSDKKNNPSIRLSYCPNFAPYISQINFLFSSILLSVLIQSPRLSSLHFTSFIHTEEGLFITIELRRLIMSCSVGGMEKSGTGAQQENKCSLDIFAETELKLGLPGVAAGERQRICGKRSFSEAMESRNFSIPQEEAHKFHEPNLGTEKQMVRPANDPPKMGPPPPQVQIVGWPPVKDFRKVRTIAASSSLYVKVSMDGAPYLRKVDLKMYSTYHDLSSALENMFGCLITMGKCGSSGMKESNLMDVVNGSEYVATYEDKDGDWMLVGDVPWQMFVDSCQRVRIMKASEAIGLGINRNYRPPITI